MMPSALKHVYVGKINFYVANQNDINTLSADELAALETECKTVEEANNTAAAQVKNLQSGFENSLIMPVPSDTYQSSTNSKAPPRMSNSRLR